MIKYTFIMIFSVLISAISQLMLKKSAQKCYESKLKEYLNPFVIFAYILFLGCTFLTMLALKVLPLSMASVLEAMGYIFVPILSYFLLGEVMNKNQIVGMSIIIFGIVIFVV